MKRAYGFIAISGFVIGLILGTIAGPLAVSYVWRSQPAADPMEYQEFRDRAIAELSTNEDLIAFDGEAPFLQQMRSTAPRWSSLLRLLMADRTVALEVKLGALPVIFDLPPEDLVNFVDHLNSLSLLDPKLFRLVMLAATNPYHASAFMKPGMVADASLINLDHRSDARIVLQNIARNPAIDKQLLESGQFMEPYAPGPQARNRSEHFRCTATPNLVFHGCRQAAGDHSYRRHRLPAALGRQDRRAYSMAWAEPDEFVDATMTIAEDGGLPVLSAEDTPDRIEHVLKSVLVGRTRAEVVPILTEMGARGAYAYDLMDTGLAAGAEVGNGYRAGDQVLTVNFGLARGGIQPDRRLRIYLAYGDGWRASDENDRISGIHEIEYYAK